MNKWVVAAVAVLVQACGAEKEIRKKVESVCRYVSFSNPTLDGIPEAMNADDLLRKEDVSALKQKEDVGAGLVAAMQIAMRPVMKAVSQARAESTTCEVLSVAVTDGRATVTVRELAPSLGGQPSEGLERIGALQKLESHAARVAKANEWFLKAEKLAVEHTVELIKTEAGWRVDLQLPEKAKLAEEKAKRAASAKAALLKSVKELGDCNLSASKTLLEEARKLVPTDEELEPVAKQIEEFAPRCIGGRWIREVTKDAMTDDVNVVVVLRSDNEVKGRFDSSRGTIAGRCREKRLELYVSTEVMIDDTYDVGVVARYRFNEEKATRVIFARSTDYHGAFFSNPKQWMTTLAARQDAILNVELPVFQSVPVVYRFTLAGADKAMVETLSACGQ